MEVGSMCFCLGFAPNAMRGWFQGKSMESMGFRALSPLTPHAEWLWREELQLHLSTNSIFLPHNTTPTQLELVGICSRDIALAAGDLFLTMVYRRKHLLCP